MQYIDEEAIRELYERAGSVALISNSARGASALVQRRYKSEPVYGMIDLSRKINQRESIGGRIGSRASPTSWVFGEYKVFGWVLACLSKASNLEIAEFVILQEFRVLPSIGNYR